MIQTNKILWGSKLLEKEEFANNEGLSWYNYDVRPYDPQIGRWHNPDILLETSPYISPYSYCDNNPVNYTDPSGMKKIPNKLSFIADNDYRDGLNGSFQTDF
jgi:RHS repeat-associated protein